MRINILTADRIRYRECIAALAAFLICAFVFYLPLFAEYAEDEDSQKSAHSEETKTETTGAGEAQWLTIKTRYFDIYYQQDVDLQTVARNLARRGLFLSGVYGPNPASAPSEKVAYRMDRIMKRVKEILGMNPDMSMLKIKIFKDRDALNEEYNKIFNTKPDYKSFYIYKYDTIYTSEEDISDSVISHEMGHAVVDHYFSMIPPEKVRELLASYVDAHLDEDEE